VRRAPYFGDGFLVPRRDRAGGRRDPTGGDAFRVADSGGLATGGVAAAGGPGGDEGVGAGPPDGPRRGILGTPYLFRGPIE
jgi:hypothetical protein